MTENTSKKIDGDRRQPSFGRYPHEGIIDLPNNTVSLTHLEGNNYSYARQSTGGETVKKTICATTKNVSVEISPLLPIHTPSYKTDFFFLRFTEPIYITQNATAQVLVPLPIEVGVFLIDDVQEGMIDCFSCDPLNSRFALYGTPEDGILCKYARTMPASSTPFMHAQFKIEITNELEEPATISKVVFPATDHDLHYHKNNVVMDGLVATVKNRLGLHVIEMVQKTTTNVGGWQTALRNIRKTDYKFSMERGFS
ncbi:DUF432 domain-containing protein [Candidatus Nitrosotenuis cloacae]|uniref:DUF432 domain-containing protein n=1 Tax=Candidatus Nitrosotenuis cloacae TaxID=1603555 RepID=UPI002280D63D|nr:DUF432 domain-containing protein [Candidatus Nitrosotenuis cloacae]